MPLQRDGSGGLFSVVGAERDCFLPTGRTRFQPGKLRVWEDVKEDTLGSTCLQEQGPPKAPQGPKPRHQFSPQRSRGWGPGPLAAGKLWDISRCRYQPQPSPTGSHALPEFLESVLQCRQDKAGFSLLVRHKELGPEVTQLQRGASPAFPLTVSAGERSLSTSIRGLPLERGTGSVPAGAGAASGPTGPAASLSGVPGGGSSLTQTQSPPAPTHPPRSPSCGRSTRPSL